VADQYIVMGDIVHSRAYDGRQLMREFTTLIGSCNTELSAGILSPYTVTIGDEFQGVARSLEWSVRTIIYLEEARLKGEVPFTLRYVVHYGDVATDVNRGVAYGMLGSGLAQAREQLADKRRGRPRFCFDLPNRQLASQLRQLFEVMSSLTRNWKTADAGLIFDMLASGNNDEIANDHGKNRSQIWKRRRSLFVDEYKALRQIVLELSEETD
jgi:SatD family (SatD)